MKRKRGIDWAGLIWRAFGWALLAFCTILFSLSCAMGKFNAAVQLWMFCTLLLLVL
jgi:hypothetical protein